MTAPSAPAAPDGATATQDTTWEQRQKHAAFYQTQVNAVQQASLALNAAAAIVVTLGIAMSKMTDFVDAGEWVPLLASLVGWLALTQLLILSYRGPARRIRAAYELEHARLFPGTAPYRLESYLLKYRREAAPR